MSGRAWSNLNAGDDGEAFLHRVDRIAIEIGGPLFEFGKIFDRSQAALRTMADGENIGFPEGPDAIAHFLNMFKSTSKNMERTRHRRSDTLFLAMLIVLLIVVLGLAMTAAYFMVWGLWYLVTT